MKSNWTQRHVLLIILCILLLTNCARTTTDASTPGTGETGNNTSNGDTNLYLTRAEGHLKIRPGNATFSGDDYEVYFHIPLSFKEQVPILLEITCDKLIDYRFVNLGAPNVLVAARLSSAHQTTSLTWRTWVLMIDNEIKRADVSPEMRIPEAGQYPEESLKWLQSTGCVQVDAPIVVETAATVRGSTTTLVKLTDDIATYVDNIPATFAHVPGSFDAVYALRWGNSCTGHAHAGAALLRANGIPARNMLNILPMYTGGQDMHWIVDYYVPQHGWVKMETTTGENFLESSKRVVCMVMEPGHENPLFYPGLEGFWYTSEPELGITNPGWGGAHYAYNLDTVKGTSEKVLRAHSLTKSVFRHNTDCWGIRMSTGERAHLESAYSFQQAAKGCVVAQDIDGYIANMQSALDSYEQIVPQAEETIFFADLEKGAEGWSHGGEGDEWELGSPTYGALSAYSGLNCWATDLDSDYENEADCWLLSPAIDLSNLASANLSVRLWNWVEDGSQGVVKDPLWMEITTDGTVFLPISSIMGGVNDDPEIPDSGGWNQLTLDLSKYIGNQVRIRFRFTSNRSGQQPGVHIDDLRVFCRREK
ncbi:MAG: hypothetical protein GY757_35335 [bacterium]|nr:hypothetical protein [bacterium]